MKNLFSREMSGFVTFLKFCSLYPYSANPLENLLLKIYSSFNLLMVLAIFYSAFFYYRTLDNLQALGLILSGVLLISDLLTQFIVILEAFNSRQDQSMIYQKFDEIEVMLQNEQVVNTNYTKLRRKLYVKYFSIMILFILAQLVVVVSTVAVEHLTPYFIHKTLSIFTVRVRCIQGMFFVDLINEKLKIMNQKIGNIVKNQRKFATKLQRFDEKVSKSSIYDQLMIWKQVYGKVSDISNIINDCVGWSLLAIVNALILLFYQKNEF